MLQKLFSIAYFPPVDYILEMKNANSVVVEAHDNYQKQTYRNRTTIFTGNGLQDLIIPVVRNSEKKITGIEIDNSVNWQRNHWKTIESAYNNSPFFLYYKDFFEPFFKEKYQFLFEYNFALLILLRKLFSIHNTITLSESYEKNVINMEDYRHYFLPKNRTFRPKMIEYQQVFSNRYGFMENITSIDYLFTMGTHF